VQGTAHFSPPLPLPACCVPNYNNNKYLMLKSSYFKGEAPIYPEGSIRVMYDSKNHYKIMKCGFEAWFYQAGAKCSMHHTSGLKNRFTLYLG
jgi:hypothetical protein